MSRWLEWDEKQDEIQIRFAYDEALVGVVRELPGRRWNPSDRYWSVPSRHLVAVAGALIPHGFRCSEELLSRLAEEGVAAEGEPPYGSPTEPTLTVSELNLRAREALRRAFETPVWLQGEVIEYDRNAHKRHVYFRLVEKEEGDDRSRAVVTAVLFERTREEVKARLAEAAEPLELADGICIRVRGRVDLYPPTGAFQFIVEEIDPEFTLGEIARRRERILAELEREGIRERNLSLPFPVPALRLALLTSYGSDAYNDFVNELERSGYSFEIDLYDCHVQGARLEGDMLRALGRVARQAARYDVAAIVRGGGSRTDLMGFDSLELARAVARLPVKVVVGIGHHRDRGVLDFIAHSEKTPTAVAQALVARAAEQEERLRSAVRRLTTSADRCAQRRRHRLAREALLLSRTLQLLLERAQGRVVLAARDLRELAGRRCEREAARLRQRSDAVSHLAFRRCSERSRDLAERRRRLLRIAVVPLAGERERLTARQSRVNSADPRRLLERGFAWLTDEQGATVRRVAATGPGRQIRARLADGRLVARVERTEKDED